MTYVPDSAPENTPNNNNNNSDNNVSSDPDQNVEDEKSTGKETEATEQSTEKGEQTDAAMIGGADEPTDIEVSAGCMSSVKTNMCFMLIMLGVMGILFTFQKKKEEN